MFKRFIAFTLSLILVLSCVPMNVFAYGNEKTTSDGFVYKELSNGGITVVGYKSVNGVTPLQLTIPAYIEGRPVIQIGDYFCEADFGKMVQTIVIPEGVTTVGPSAFECCDNLTTVILPSSLQWIGVSAFDSCIKLNNVTLPENLLSIESFAFRGCVSLTSMNLPSNISKMGTSVFRNCSRLKSITLSCNLYEIPENTFENCTSLVNIVLPSNVDVIGREAFKGCSVLNTVVLPSNLTTLGDWCFTNCEQLKNINIGNTKVSTIGAFAFSGCYNLEKINLPSTLHTLGADAFASCKRLQDFTLPASVTNCDFSTFLGCDNLTSMVIPGNIKTIPKGMFQSCDRLEKVVLNDGVSIIGANAFEDCKMLKSITIPTSVTQIGDWALGWLDTVDNIYYVGTKEQWNAIAKGYGSYNNVTIHYNSTGPSAEKQKQTIKAKNLTKTYGTKPFSIGASAKTKLSYSSSDKKVATINKSGKVTIKGCGITKITIKAASSKKYNAAKKVVTLTVKPKKASIGSVKSNKKKTIVVKWKRDSKSSGYDMQYKSGKKSKIISVNGNKKTSYTIKKLKGGAKYQVRVRSYVKSHGKKVTGSWSKYKTIKVKK